MLSAAGQHLKRRECLQLFVQMRVALAVAAAVNEQKEQGAEICVQQQTHDTDALKETQTQTQSHTRRHEQQPPHTSSYKLRHNARSFAIAEAGAPT